MKSQIALLLIIFAVAASGCVNKVEVSQPNEFESQKVKQMGDELAQTLLDTLGATLKNSIQKDGPVDAIKVCKTEAQAIASRISANAIVPVEIKRTTYRFRNPQNAPDSFEKIALDHFNEFAENGQELPLYYIQKIKLGDDVSYNYFKPLKIQSVCLACHGDPATTESSLRATIAENYPEDKATGYKLGDFRGLVRVKIESLE